jgi:cytochrome b pre-mRNA-processing protein 3
MQGMHPIMLDLFSRSKQRRDSAARIYAALLARARDPVFFARFGVPASLDGRFDLLTLHAWLVLDRLAGKEPAQALVDLIFSGFDEALREQGAGDIAMARRMAQFAGAFYGRLKAYGEARDAAALAAALARNLYRGEAPCAPAIAAYVLRARERLAAWNGGPPDFGPLPGKE